MIAIITARGGSKRIPHKNIKDFCGKSILAYSIEAAKKAGIFDTVMVSTDSPEIAEIAVQYGAAVPFMRSESTSNDHAPTAEVIREVLMKYAENGVAFDQFCCIYPTAPFVTAHKLRKAANMLAESDADSLLSVVAFSFPPQRAFILRDGIIQYQYPENARLRSQDLETIYHDAGQFYFCKTKAFLEQNTLITRKSIPFIMPEEEVQDIDNFSDWRLAELKYQLFLQKGGDT